MNTHVPIPFTDIDRVLSILNKISLFGGLSDIHLAAVFKTLERVTYVDGETIFEEGGSPSEIFIILEGSVKVVLNYNHSPLVIAEFSVGNCLGETSAIGIQPHSATAIAHGSVELLVLTKKALMTFFHEDPKLFGYITLNIAREACRRLSKADNTLLHYVNRGVKFS
ncbi:MAG: cyclic nucleotide-binding domain-containing protein [Fibrobacterales bacterium]